METVTKVNLACGSDYREGYLNIDDGSMLGSKYDIETDIFEYKMPRDSVDEILLSHFIMYLTPISAFKMFERWNFWLKKGGKLIIETQDLKKLSKVFLNSKDPSVINRDVIQLYGAGNTKGHKWTWCRETLIPILKYAGFTKFKVQDGGTHNRPDRDITIIATK